MTLAFMPPADPSCKTGDKFHPLEVIPFFKRIPQSTARDFAYTFIWSAALGTIFWIVSVAGDLRAFNYDDFSWNIIFASAIGYSIHGLFALGDWSGIEGSVRQLGHGWRTVYYSGVSTLGLIVGFSFVATTIDNGMMLRLLKNPQWLAWLTVSSIVLSVILSMIFFWRERHARAEAELQAEKLRATRIERESVFANLRALQAQIEPHFLFNTLANVASLVDPDPAKAKRMLESFIRFLRASLSATRNESTTLADEGELIAAYLDVLQIRMGARLRYDVDIPADLHSVTLPPMLLQPVVENSIKHGLEPKVEGGTVSVRAHRNGNGVAVEIADTGVGFLPTTRGGMGLTNVRDRLRLIYGERASLAVTEAAQGGAVVTVTIPA
jgi:sensor histidine kinase YesM